MAKNFKEFLKKEGADEAANQKKVQELVEIIKNAGNWLYDGKQWVGHPSYKRPLTIQATKHIDIMMFVVLNTGIKRYPRFGVTYKHKNKFHRNYAIYELTSIETTAGKLIEIG